MFACLLLPNFRLQAALRWRDPVGCGGHASGDLSVGSAVVEDGGVLVEVNAAARARGLVPGLTGPQAMARDAAVRIFSPEGAQEDSLSDLLVDQALGLSPDVERTASGVVTIDLRHAARGVCWQQLADGVVARFQNRTLQVQVGVAGTPDLAYLAAQGARPSAIVYQAAAFVGTLPLEALDLSEALALTFQDWGLRSVGDFLRLPKSETIQRLGAEGETLFHKVSGRYQRPLRLLRTPPEYRAAFSFEHEIETTEPLLFLLRRFLEELTDRLRAVHRVAREMELRVPLDDGTVHERIFFIPAPTSAENVLFGILHTHLESLRLAQRPVGVQLKLESAAPARDQLRLFDRALRDPNQFGETLARLKALLGNEHVGVPVRRDTHEAGGFEMQGMFIQSSDGPERSPDVAYGLPLRRYRPAVRGRVEMEEGRPATVSSPLAVGRVFQWAGPFRLSGRWWESSSWAMEEWDVGLEDGGLYRLARRGRAWTVEGCYDVC